MIKVDVQRLTSIMTNWQMVLASRHGYYDEKLWLMSTFGESVN